ncbi:hypothetical protein [Kutzneria sp. 744]|uniref:hypothetical protein n=1 Tax=Kutzneria sp. (strain 744) TaxID=345341 RepID=UPI0004B580C5|nr:hypothetical protein [Kutzneria sp. 744]
MLAATYCAEKVERMGDLAAHIADAARFDHHGHTVPTELEPTFADLGQVTASMADRLAELITAPAAGAFAELENTDCHVDQLHAGLLATTLDLASPARQWLVLPQKETTDHYESPFSVTASVITPLLGSPAP